MVQRLLLILLLFRTVPAETLPRLDGPVSLPAAVRFALAHHPSLAVADSEWHAAQARVYEAEAAKLGVGLYLNGGNSPMIVPGARGSEPPFWAALPAGGSSLNLSLMVPLYTGGRLQARLARAQAEERAQVARTALAFREVARQTRRSYYNALQARARLETAYWKLPNKRSCSVSPSARCRWVHWPGMSNFACRPKLPPHVRRSTLRCGTRHPRLYRSFTVGRHNKKSSATGKPPQVAQSRCDSVEVG